MKCLRGVMFAVQLRRLAVSLGHRMVFRLGFLLSFAAAFSHPVLRMVCDCRAFLMGFLLS